jgi:uncharacterized protein (DUF885 family)
MTSVHQICDQYVEEYAALHPVDATAMGVPGYDDQLTDYSPQGHQARGDLARKAEARVRAAVPTDDSERTAQAIFLERIGVELEMYDAGLKLASLNVLASPVQEIRMIFDLMPRQTDDDWRAIAARMAKVPDALDGVRVSLLEAADKGRVSALRQLTKVAEQADTWAGLSGRAGFFVTLISGASDVSDEIKADLERGAQVAQKAYAELAGFLRAELAPRAPTKDAVGEETYRLCSRYFLGAEVDLREAYEWGWAEFSRIESQMREVSARIKPGASLAEVAEFLNQDERYTIRGRTEFEQWMRNLSDEALKSLQGKHFDIPDSLMELECKIAPPGGGNSAYYTPPSEDFSRPGRMWWSVSADKQEFSTWREVSTVYHEGVPGHHLQVGTTVYQSSTLNRFQRLLSFTSGHGEGWALYAERLMQDLGYLSDDADLLGMLDAQLFRTARVIIDIGMHLELEIPKETGFHEGERWTPELGLEFMLTRTITDPELIHDEIDRYLGWPGQAPAYKLGERLWLAAREEARERQGDAFDIKEFHTKALRLGGMGLDTLREQLALLDAS